MIYVSQLRKCKSIHSPKLKKLLSVYRVKLFIVLPVPVRKINISFTVAGE